MYDLKLSETLCNRQSSLSCMVWLGAKFNVTWRGGTRIKLLWKRAKMYDRGGMRNEGLVGLPRGSYRAMSAVHVLCFVFAILHLIFIIKTPCL
jgi:hypothetical protein